MMPDIFDMLPFDEQTKNLLRSARSGMIYQTLLANHDICGTSVREPHSVIEHRIQVASEILARHTHDDGKVVFASCKPDKERLPDFCMYLFHPTRGMILTTVYKKVPGKWKTFHMRRRKPQGGRKKKHEM